MQRSFPRKSFTLIEMLIVIVIIGILAAALVPRLQDMQGRARDTRRDTDMTQIYTAMLIYYEDQGSLPVTSAYGESNGGGWDLSSVSGFLTFLISGGIVTSVPVDPINNYVGSSPQATGRYTYRYFCYPGAPIGMVMGFSKENGTLVYKTSTGGIRDSYMTKCQ